MENILLVGGEHCEIEEFGMTPKVKKGVAQLKRKAVAAARADDSESTASESKVGRRKRLPVVGCRNAAAREITPKRAAKILLDQDLKWIEEAGR